MSRKTERACLAAAVAALALMAAPAAHAADPVIAAGGDVACAPEDSAWNGGAGTPSSGPGSPGRCHAKHTSDLFAGLAPLHILALGDLQYENGSLGRFEKSYAPSWGRRKSITKPVPGNHEYGSGGQDVDKDAGGYFKYFETELAAEGPDAGNPRKGWYSFDVPVPSATGGPPFDWHFVALNSECAAGLAPQVSWEGGCAVGSEQERWLREDLAADDSDCTVAYWHDPRFSSGEIGDSAIMAPMFNALYEDYADIVLSGHDHDYERFAQLGPTGQPEPGRGVRQLVVGTGGKSLFERGQTRPPTSEVFQNTVYGVLKLTLHGPAAAHPNGWYEWEFVDDGHSGSDFVDAGSADCVSPAKPPPAAKPSPAAKPAAAPDRLAPSISRASLSPRRFRVGPRRTAVATGEAKGKVARGTTIRYRLSEAATVTLRMDRGLSGRKVRLKGSPKRRCVAQTQANAKRGNARCTVYRKSGALTAKGAAGARQVKFSGRMGRRKLKPARYRLTLSARDAAANAGKPVRLRFTVVK